MQPQRLIDRPKHCLLSPFPQVASTNANLGLFLITTAAERGRFSRSSVSPPPPRSPWTWPFPRQDEKMEETRRCGAAGGSCSILRRCRHKLGEFDPPCCYPGQSRPLSGKTLRRFLRSAAFLRPEIAVNETGSRNEKDQFRWARNTKTTARFRQRNSLELGVFGKEGDSWADDFPNSIFADQRK